MKTGESRERSPRFKARIAGLFWLMTMLLGGFAAFNGDTLVVSGDAATTANNILTHESLFRWAVVTNLVATICYLAATLLVYFLLKPVNRNLFFARRVLQPRGMRRFRRQFHFESCASGRSWRRAILECFQPRTVAGAGADLPQIEFSDLQHRDDIFRATCPLGRLPDFQVNLPAADSRRPRSNHRCMLPDERFREFPLTSVQRLFVSVRCGQRPGR